jgi:hypothetical protein
LIRTRLVIVGSAALFVISAALWLSHGCNDASVNNDWDGGGGGNQTCTDAGCTNNNTGGDCGVRNTCGICGGGSCTTGGKGSAFPTDKTKDPNVKDTTGVKVDSNGDITLDTTTVNYNYMWISNTFDTAGASTCATSSPPSGNLCRGTVSKIDTVNMKEVARYFSTTCHSQSGTSCVDVNGKSLTTAVAHTPSRTAVDYNFDVWVANRNLYNANYQPVATKIANESSDCVDRNNNGKIDTSSDVNGDGKIEIDCDGDGKPDSASTTCTNGKSPEFLGDDDECVLFSTLYGEAGDVGRSLCLDAGKSTVGASDAWVGTFFRPELGHGVNRFYQLNGYTGKLETTVDLPSGHHTYGCMADQYHIVWSTDIGTSYGSTSWTGSLTYFQTLNPNGVGGVMRAKDSTGKQWKDASGDYRHYGISVDGNANVWLGGYSSYWVLRYKPDRTSFSTLGNGTWARIDMPSGFYTRGIAADARGKVWVAIQDGGYIARIPQNIADGRHDYTKMTDYWALKADTVIGVGVDFSGNVWGIGYKNGTASRLDVDSTGAVKTPATGTTKSVTVGTNPYTYSDFTGYGLINFVRPSGRYIYELKPCPSGVKAQWKQVDWTATTPTSTSISVRVRSGDTETSFGSWSQVFTSSPAAIGPKASGAITPNPSYLLEVEFTLSTSDKSHVPILNDYTVTYTCANTTS